ncbi:TetR/AcrR family transcriptional regulator [Metabacillus fastidiosus]|uniref:TetR/AcrR family transcriptional regulator n=1 Tax=Metabacillus fastidiosus TaxID=1458 RepID=UPI003D2AF082
MKTKDKIINTSIQLFNQFGTSSISTNHIAKSTGISPGNLYYYFKNKEEIIRAIFEKMICDWDKLWLPPADWKPGLIDFKNIIKQSLHLEWEYRFFQRELITLIKLDEELKNRHQQIQLERMNEQKKLFQLFINEKIIKQPDDIDSLLTTCWIISNYWISFLESRGEVINEKKMEHGIELIMVVIKPYIINN